MNGQTVELMQPSEAWIDGARTVFPEDAAIYQKICDGLPMRREDTPYHSQAHSVRNFRILSQMGLLGSVLEIGFCLGRSASLFLHFGAGSVVSVDNSRRTETIVASQVVRGKHYNFRFIQGDALDDFDRTKELLRHQKYTLAYIDGDHSIVGVDADTNLVLELGCEHILFDDFFPHWGPGVQPAIKKYGLVPICLLGSMALCRKAF